MCIIMFTIVRVCGLQWTCKVVIINIDINMHISVSSC